MSEKRGLGNLFSEALAAEEAGIVRLTDDIHRRDTFENVSLVSLKDGNYRAIVIAEDGKTSYNDSGLSLHHLKTAWKAYVQGEPGAILYVQKAAT